MFILGRPSINAAEASKADIYRTHKCAGNKPTVDMHASSQAAAYAIATIQVLEARIPGLQISTTVDRFRQIIDSRWQQDWVDGLILTQDETNSSFGMD